MSLGLLIRPSVLAAALDRPDWVLLDCRFDLADAGRGEREYALAHIPGAHYAHLDRDLSAPITATSGRHPLPDVDDLKQFLGRQGIRRGVQVVVYDDSGGSMAARLWWLLRWLGHTQVALLDGGWQAWIAAGLPLQHRLPQANLAVEFSGQADATMLLTSPQIEDNLRTRQWLLLDARSDERFRAEQEPIDPVAGHIPGSVNHPLTRNLDSAARFLPAAELRQAYLQSLGDYRPQRAACLCGSGVSACHNLMAMEIAGLCGARLYAGSWSEWIRDPQRPIAVGF